METIKSWYHRIDAQVDRLIRQYKRKKFLLKAKVFLLFVLPVLILLIGVKAAKTWMRIKVRGIATASPSPKLGALATLFHSAAVRSRGAFFCVIGRSFL